MSIQHYPMLSMLIFWPLFGALCASFTRSREKARLVALIVALIELAGTLLVLSQFDREHGGDFQLSEHYAWIPSLNVDILLGVDGIAILFLPLSALLTVIAILASWNSIRQLQAFHYSLFLALQGITIGVFTALNTVLFFLFWELTLPPIFFLLGLWGIGPKRREAAIKYTLFMLFGGTSLLAAFILLAINTPIPDAAQGALLTFNLSDLLANPIADSKQTSVFLLLLLGFGVKTPLVPFHTWLPTAAMEGETQLVALLTGLKLGAYGMIRFTMTLAPSAAVEYSWLLGVIGAITLIYGTLIALQQTNLRRLLAYASISHVGLVIVGIAALNMQGIQGAIFQLVNFTFIASALMLIAGFIQYRLGSTESVHLGGLAKVVPKLTCFYFLFALASIAIPGTSGFPAELLLIVSALVAHPSLGIAGLVAAVIGAAYMLDFTRKTFWGPVRYLPVNRIHDLRAREVALLAIPALMVLLAGFAPNLILRMHEKAADAWLTRILEQPVKSDGVAAEILE